MDGHENKMSTFDQNSKGYYFLYIGTYIVVHIHIEVKQKINTQ